LRDSWGTEVSEMLYNPERKNDRIRKLNGIINNTNYFLAQTQRIIEGLKKHDCEHCKDVLIGIFHAELIK
jgi:hypothetical protein